MSLISKSQIIVLHLTKCGDSGGVVHVLDSLSGRRSLYLRGIRKSKNNAVLPNFHSLSILDIVSSSSPKSTLSYLREYSRTYPLEELRSDPYKTAIAMFISEVIYRSIRNDDSDSSIFLWLTDTIVALNDLPGMIANYHLWWLVGFCTKMGFHPENNYSADRPYFDIEAACFTSSTYPEESHLSFNGDDSLLLHRLLTSPLSEALAIPLSSSKRCSFAQKMVDYLSYHLGFNINIKSLGVLHDLFN